MSRYVKIGEAAKYLGVSVQTLRRWEVSGYLLPDRKSSGKKGETRYYDLNKLSGFHQKENDVTLAYGRVSSQDQKADLDRQMKHLQDYCSAKGWNYLLISDLGSGLNYRKKGLKQLLHLILENKIQRLVLTHKDRLLRFGSELIFSLCEAKGIEVILIHSSEDKSFEEELAQDVLEIITVFSARLYGKRSHKNKKIVEAAKILTEGLDAAGP